MQPVTKHDVAIQKSMDAMKGIIAALDPEGKIKVTRTEALEWWDKARIAHKQYTERRDGYGN